MTYIAKMAGIGVGTLYNYFPSKGDFLLGLVSSRSTYYVLQMDRILSGPPKESHSRKAVELAKIYLASFNAFNKRIWREFLGFALSSRPELFREIRAIDDAFVDRLARIYSKEQAECLYSAWIYHVMEFLTDEAMSQEKLLKVFARDLKVYST